MADLRLHEALALAASQEACVHISVCDQRFTFGCLGLGHIPLQHGDVLCWETKAVFFFFF